VLEQVRLLTNLETDRQKLMQIILVGQPELRALLERRDLRQLAQRITARYHLEPISLGETYGYIYHRLRMCGLNHSLFTKKAIRMIHRSANGIPRLINVICDRALMGAFSEDKRYVDSDMARHAAREIKGSRSWMQRLKRRWPLQDSLSL
jgi:general secretion pathway protein A